jgi:hypothetical protein
MPTRTLPIILIVSALIVFGCAGVIAAEAGILDYTHPVYAAAENSLIAAALGALVMVWAARRESVSPSAGEASPAWSQAGWRTIAVFVILWGLTIVLRAIAPANAPLVLIFMPIALLVLPGTAVMLGLFTAPHPLMLLALAPPLSLALMMIATAWAIRLGVALTPLFFIGAGAVTTFACLLLIARRIRVAR